MKGGLRRWNRLEQRNRRRWWNRQRRRSRRGYHQTAAAWSSSSSTLVGADVGPDAGGGRRKTTSVSLLREILGAREARVLDIQDSSYRTSSYVISYSLVTMPQLIAPSIVFASITFWTVGLNGGLQGFFFYVLIIYASFWSGSSVVTFISGVLPNIMLSYMVATSYLAYCLLLC